MAALKSASSGVVRTPPPPARSVRKTSTGSGFIVSPDGHVLTNEHVVRSCREVRTAGTRDVKLVAREKRIDLALLKANIGGRKAATFRGGRGIRTGDDVFVVGYPLHGLLAAEVNVTRGIVSALAGPGEDRRIVQITAPVQPGNSGGPVLDASGNVVGVVVGKINALKIAKATGSIPENINFAIGEGAARAFLDAHDVAYETVSSGTPINGADIAARAKAFTVLIECWK